MPKEISQIHENMVQNRTHQKPGGHILMGKNQTSISYARLYWQDSQIAMSVEYGPRLSQVLIFFLNSLQEHRKTTSKIYLLWKYATWCYNDFIQALMHFLGCHECFFNCVVAQNWTCNLHIQMLISAQMWCTAVVVGDCAAAEIYSAYLQEAL